MSQRGWKISLIQQWYTDRSVSFVNCSIAILLYSLIIQVIRYFFHIAGHNAFSFRSFFCPTSPCSIESFYNFVFPLLWRSLDWSFPVSWISLDKCTKLTVVCELCNASGPTELPLLALRDHLLHFTPLMTYLASDVFT